MNFFKKYKEELEGIIFFGIIALIVSVFGLFYLAVLFIGMWVLLFFSLFFSKNGSSAVMPVIMGIPLLVIGLILLYFAEIPPYLSGKEISNTNINIHSAPPTSIVEGNK
jgi:hypothetical protein